MDRLNVNPKKWILDGRNRRFQLGQRDRKTRRDELLLTLRNYSLSPADPLATLLSQQQKVRQTIVHPLHEAMQDIHQLQATIEALQLIASAFFGGAEGTFSSDEVQRRNAAALLVSDDIPRALESWMGLEGNQNELLCAVADSSVAAALALDSAVSPIARHKIWTDGDLLHRVFLSLSRISNSSSGASAVRCYWGDTLAAEEAINHQSTLPFLRFLLQAGRHGEFFMFAAALCRKEMVGMGNLVGDVAHALKELLPTGMMTADDKYYAIRVLRDGAESSGYWELVRSELTMELLDFLLRDADDGVANCTMDIISCYQSVNTFDCFKMYLRQNCTHPARQLAAIECLAMLPALAVQTDDMFDRSGDNFLLHVIRPLISSDETPASLWLGVLRLLVAICVEGYADQVRACCAGLDLSPQAVQEGTQEHNWLEALQYGLMQSFCTGEEDE